MSNDNNLMYRQMNFRPNTWDEETRSIEAVGASEAPARMYDPVRGRMVNEVLLMAGAKLPHSLPLTIEHEKSAKAVIGSFRDMKVDNSSSPPSLIGRVYFAADEESFKYAGRVRDGHLENFSIVYGAKERSTVDISERETKIIDGKSFTGPMVVTQEWEPRSLGLVLYPADRNAKSRNENEIKKEVTQMDEITRKFLERQGLPANATEAEAIAFMGRAKEEPEPKIDVEKIRSEMELKERQRVADIAGMCRNAGCDDLIEGFVNDGTDTEKAQSILFDKMVERAKKPPTQRVTVEHDEHDKFRAAATGSIMMRSGIQWVSKVDTTGLPEALAEEYTTQAADCWKSLKAPGASDLRGYSMKALARKCCDLNGLKHGGDDDQLLARAMSTSDFPLILADSARKSMAMGYISAQETWSSWCSIGSVKDFNAHTTHRLSEFGSLVESAEDEELTYAALSESQESYQIAEYKRGARITRKLLINDDMGAFTKLMNKMGDAAARLVGDAAYAALTANAVMGDGIALFNASHSNFVAHGSGAAPGVATLSAMDLAFGLQTDLDGTVLGLTPEHLIMPRALKMATEIFFNSMTFSDPQTIATDATPASTQKNIFAGKYNRVYEHRLDADDTAAWYAAGQKGNTVEVFFLNGNQTPYFAQEGDWGTSGIKFMVRHDVGAKALDWRYLYYNDGN